MQIKAKNINDAYSYFKDNGISILNEPASGPDGEKTFFVMDPYRNIFQIVTEIHGFLMNTSDRRNIWSFDRSLRHWQIKELYSDILGYDTVVYDKKENFPTSPVCREEKQFQKSPAKTIWACNRPFSKLFGMSVIELISSTGAPGKKIYDERLWGDPGFIHLCFDIQGMDEIRDYCSEKGFPFTVDTKKVTRVTVLTWGSSWSFCLYRRSGWRTYRIVETQRFLFLKNLAGILTSEKGS